MNKVFWRIAGLMLFAAALGLAIVPSPPAEAGVGCGKSGYWLASIESCSNLSPTNCIVVCAY